MRNKDDRDKEILTNLNNLFIWRFYGAERESKITQSSASPRPTLEGIRYLETTSLF